MRFKKIGFIVLCIMILLPCFCRAQQNVNRAYDWYAEEKLTVSSTVKQLTAAEYNYDYGFTRINVQDANSIAFQRDEVVTSSTGAMGTLDDCDDCNSVSWLAISIKYNGPNAATFADGNSITGATSGARAYTNGTYTRGTNGHTVKADTKLPWIAEIHVLDNSIIWTSNLATPVYSATDSACFGKKQYEGNTFYLFGPRQIENFKAIRASGTDAIIYARYGR